MLQPPPDCERMLTLERYLGDPILQSVSFVSLMDRSSETYRICIVILLLFYLLATVPTTCWVFTPFNRHPPFCLIQRDLPPALAGGFLFFHRFLPTANLASYPFFFSISFFGSRSTYFNTVYWILCDLGFKEPHNV